MHRRRHRVFRPTRLWSRVLNSNSPRSKYVYFFSPFSFTFFLFRVTGYSSVILLESSQIENNNKQQHQQQDGRIKKKRKKLKRKWPVEEGGVGRRQTKNKTITQSNISMCWASLIVPRIKQCHDSGCMCDCVTIELMKYPSGMTTREYL